MKRRDGQSVMKKVLRNILRRIADYLRETVNDELKVMDAFYQQFA